MPHRVKRCSTILLTTTLIWGSLVLFAASDGGSSFVEYLAFVYGGLVFGGITVLAASAATISAVRQPVPFPRVLLFQMLLLACVYLGVRHDLAFAARFYASREALAHAARATHEQSAKASHPRRIGLFRVTETDTAGRAVRFITSTCGLDDCGVVYHEGGEPPRVGEDSYLHIEGPWWHWHRSW